MTNQEIINAIDDLINQNLNYCDFILELKVLNKSYKKSNFYKETHISLNKLVKNYKEYQLLNLDSLFALIQEKINELDVSKLQDILEGLQENLAIDFENNKESLSILSDFSKIIQEDRGE